MANQGWIKVDKGLVDLWRGTKKLPWWIDLLIMTSYGDVTIARRYANIELRKGQLCTSIAELSASWGASKSTVAAFIKELCHLSLIKVDNARKSGSIITIISTTPKAPPNGQPNGKPNGQPNGKQANLQHDNTPPPNGQPNGKPNGQPNGQPNGNNKKEDNKKIEEEKEKTPYGGKKEKPEGLKFVVRFFLDNNSTSDEASRFYDYFESNGWKVGGRAAMKDWKAAARNWIRNANKYANRYYHSTTASYQDAKREFAETAARVTERFMRGEG